MKGKVIRGYKGFDKDLKCRGFQYEVGKEYECERAIACEEGFHFCENPTDVLYYYEPVGSRYCEVEGSGDFDKKNDKLCCTKIRIIREFTLQDFIKECKGYSNKKHKKSSFKKKFKLKDLFVKHIGKENVADNHFLVVNKRFSKFVDNATNSSVLVNIPKANAVNNSGNYSVVCNVGSLSLVNDSGYSSLLANKGNSSLVKTIGFDSLIADDSAFSHDIVSNKGSVSVTTGSFSLAAAETNDSLAIAAGFGTRAKGALGSWIVLAERDAWNGEYSPIKEVKVFKVDGETVKPDTPYKLVDGKLVETKE